MAFSLVASSSAHTGSSYPVRVPFADPPVASVNEEFPSFTSCFPLGEINRFFLRVERPALVIASTLHDPLSILAKNMIAHAEETCSPFDCLPIFLKDRVVGMPARKEAAFVHRGWVRCAIT